MKRDKEVKPFAWPTKEPEMAAPPVPAVAGEPAPEEAGTPTTAPIMDKLGRLVAPEAPAADVLPDGISPDSTHAFLWENADAAAAVLRTMMQQDDAGVDDGPLTGMTARQVAAATMSGLGIEVGTRVMRHLHVEAEARWIGRALAEEPAVIHRVALAALQAVRQRIEAGDYLEEGGPDYAARLLESAFHRGRVSRLLRRSREEPSFQALKGVAPEQIAPYISHEHPQTIALCLTQLDSAMAAGILGKLPERLQADVAYRMTTMQTITPEALRELEEAMEASLGDILSGNVHVGGPKVMADVLNLAGSSVEKNVLDQIDAQDPEISEQIARRMFTFADLDRMTDRELKIILKAADAKDLVISLKACGEGFRQRLLNNLSEQARTSIAAEMEQLEPMRLSEVEEVQLRILKTVRQLEEKGKVTILRGAADETWV